MPKPDTRDLPPLARKLVELRRAKGLTIPQMAGILGVPKGTYRGYEYDRREVSLLAGLRIAAYYGLTVDQMITLLEEDASDKKTHAAARELVAKVRRLKWYEVKRKKVERLSRAHPVDHS